ncbi:MULTISPECIES: glycosyltransferase family 2 protein [unclassified Pseudomonas]|uniref:glycosyltransferase family 2 protein n=1 Tax=unclassified Pseudomonas TaxID=196821 RepID=UPI0025DF34F9|nr:MULTISPECIES: glycosyltransferase family 2 protein [unclassified Pseudomonas]
MDSQRLVSVVIAVCRTEFFETALRSVIGQTHDAIEIVVCDDTDDGLAETVTDLYRASCPWPIRYLRNEHPEGAEACFLRGIRESAGHYVKFLSGDALLGPQCIQQMLKAIEVCPDARLVSAHRQWQDADGKLLPENLTTRFRVTEPTVLCGPDVVAVLGEFTCNFIGEFSSLLCRRADLLALGEAPFSLGGESLGPLSELALCANLLQTGDLILLPQTLSASRIAPRHLTEQGIEIAGADTDFVHRFHRLIRQAGWASTTLANGWVGSRPLGSGSDFADFDLLANLSAPAPQRLNSQQVQAWLNYRIADEPQKKQIDAHLARVGVPTLLVVVNDAENLPARVQQTLNSFGLRSPLHASLRAVVISQAGELPESPSGVRLSLVKPNQAGFATVLNEIVEAHDFDWLMVIDAGTQFTPFGLTACALQLARTPDSPLAFADQMYRNPKGGLSSALRPDFNLDYLLSYPLVAAAHWLFRRQTLVDLGGFDRQFTDAAQFDAILRLIESKGASQIVHVCEPLLVCDLPPTTHNQHEIATLERHLKVRGYRNAKVLHTLPRRYHVLYGHSEQPLVSIIVPTKDQLPFLQRCVETLLHKTRYPNYELLIVDNNSQTPEALQWLAQTEALGSQQVQVLRYPHPFNYSRINNVAAAQARGEYLVLLNNDTAIVHETWLDELLNHALRPEVGVVGAKLLFPNGRMQHAGVRLGMDGPAGHQHIGEPQHIQGYMQRVQVDQDLSAVTAACLMVRRSIYEEVGGLDETAFVVSYNDVDLCLKVGALGYLNVWTPHSVLIHEGSVSQTHVDTATQQAKRKRFVGEQLAMYSKWLPLIGHDPAFNPNLSFDLQSVELELNMQLVWRPMAWRCAPVVLAYPDGLWASPDERLIAPVETLDKQGVIEARLSSSPLSIPQEARLKPDVIVYQARLDADHVQSVARARVLPNAFVVLDINDLHLAANDAGADAFAFCPERLQTLQQSLQQAQRVVASTQLLADIASEFHADVRLVPSRLRIDTWGRLTSRRGRGYKPRVGLVNDNWQVQDLHMILPVVQALADEVEWVVMGDHQGLLRSHAAEWHELPAGDQYASALAALDLDLALLPAVDNLFSACKSNLSALKVGACGVPLVCSDVRAYAGDLQLTRVPNTLSDWLAAIRAHISDLPAAALLGDQLREQVLRDWMLDDAAMQVWQTTWLPDR